MNPTSLTTLVAGVLCDHWNQAQPCRYCWERSEKVAGAVVDALLSGRYVVDEADDGTPLLLDCSTDPAKVVSSGGN